MSMESWGEMPCGPHELLNLHKEAIFIWVMPWWEIKPRG